MKDDVSRLGFYDDACQERPRFDPGLKVSCPICDKPLSDPLRTISLLPQSSTRSYFYRVHRSCHEPLSPADIQALDDRMLAGCWARDQ
jgi:hypothetical protein